MTAQPPPTPAQADGAHAAAIERMQAREAALRQQAAQLQARAEHLQRVGRVQAQQLKRRVDAHEKIVLGALLKKAGMDWPLTDTTEHNERHPNDNDASPFRQGIAAQSTAYDRELILGALMWLASVLKQPDHAVVTVPERQRLRDNGRQALDKPVAPPSPQPRPH